MIAGGSSNRIGLTRYHAQNKSIDERSYLGNLLLHRIGATEIATIKCSLSLEQDMPKKRSSI